MFIAVWNQKKETKTIFGVMKSVVEVDYFYLTDGKTTIGVVVKSKF